jgi:hypothetical protein
MRKFINVSRQVQAELEGTYSSIGDIRYEDNEFLNHWLAISFVDHWLDGGDPLLDNVSADEHSERRKRYFNFIEKLVKSHELFTFRMKGKLNKNRRIQFKRFASESCAIKYLMSADYSRTRAEYPIALIPSCEAILYEQYDYTSALCYRDVNRVSSILEAARNCGLYILKERCGGSGK